MRSGRSSCVQCPYTLLPSPVDRLSSFQVSHALGSDLGALRPGPTLASYGFLALTLVLHAQLESHGTDFASTGPGPTGRASRRFRIVLLAGDYGFHEACVAEEMAYDTDASISQFQSKASVS